MSLGWPQILVSLALLGISALYVARALVRRWSTRVINDANRSLRLPIPTFALRDRKAVIEQLLNDEQVRGAIEKQSIDSGEPVPSLHSRCRRYADEMVPAFRALFYFRIGYWLARTLLLSHYRVHARIVDEKAIDEIDRHSSAILVSNHRSNMDVLLLNYLASHRSTLMHAAGEWARLWPLNHLIRMAGNYVVDRDSKDRLYHAVLKAYVQMAVSEGAHLAIFPEGELTRDGAMLEPKFGLLSYAATARRHGLSADVHFIPVAVNFDYVPEEKKLIGIQDATFRQHGKMYLFLASVRATVTMLIRVMRPSRAQFGNACASFGKPISLKSWRAAHGVDVQDAAATRQWVASLGEEIMRMVRQLVPILPVHALANKFLEDPNRAWSRDQLLPAIQRSIGELNEKHHIVCIPDEKLDDALDDALYSLQRRKLILVDDAGKLRVNAVHLARLQYLANSIRHLFKEIVVENDEHSMTLSRREAK